MAKSEYEIKADKFMKDTGSKMVVGSPEYGKMPNWDDKDSRYIFPITFVRKVNGETRQFSLKFGQSIADGNKKPTHYDVLACLTKSNPGSFENFCSDFGYNSDSRKAERIYNAVCSEWNSVDRLWHDVLETLQDIN